MTPDKIDETVRRALHETADQMQPSPDAWAQMNERRPSRRGVLRKPFFIPVSAAAAVVAVVVVALVAQNLGGNDHQVVAGPTAGGVQMYALGSVPDGYEAAPMRAAFRARAGDTDKEFPEPEQTAASAVCLRTSGEGADRVCADATGIVARSYQTADTSGPEAVSIQIATGYGSAPWPDLLSDASRPAPVDVTVRGKPGRYGLGGGAFAGTAKIEILTWTERPGIHVVITRSGPVQGADAMIKLAEDLRAEQLSLDVAPAVVASGDLPTRGPGTEDQRWYLAVGSWPPHGNCATIVALPAATDGPSPGYVRCVWQPVRGALTSPLVRPFSATGEGVAWGYAGGDVSSVRLTADGHPTIDVTITGREQGLEIGFWAVWLPKPDTYTAVGLDAVGNPVSAVQPIGPGSTRSSTG